MAWTDNPTVFGLTLDRGFLIAWSLLMLSAGTAWIVAPERALRWTYRWNDRYWRWITFGRVKRTPGPKFMRDDTAKRVMPWVGFVCAFVGAATLLWMLFATLN